MYCLDKFVLYHIMAYCKKTWPYTVGYVDLF